MTSGRNYLQWPLTPRSDAEQSPGGFLISRSLTNFNTVSLKYIILAHPLGAPQVRAFYTSPGFAGWFFSPISASITRLPWQLHRSKSVSISLTALVKLMCFMKEQSLRYRLTNDRFDDFHLQLIIETSAPVGCASSKGFLITHPASPVGSFRPFQITRLPWQLSSSQLCAHNVFYEGALSPLTSHKSESLPDFTIPTIDTIIYLSLNVF
eukprot:sb/3470285/